jgi:hypothetical protein
MFTLTINFMKNERVDKKIPKSKGGKTKSSPRKSINDRDLNEDAQDQETNAEREEDWSEEKETQDSSSENDVDAEEEREKKRKVEDVHRDEWMK